MMTDDNNKAEKKVPQESVESSIHEEGDERRKKYEVILDKSIDKMLAFSEKLDDLIDHTNSKSIPSLVNTRARVQSELTNLIIVAMNPKLKLTPDSLRNKDLARLIQIAAEDEEGESPSAEKDPQSP